MKMIYVECKKTQNSLIETEQNGGSQGLWERDMGRFKSKDANFQL